MVKIKASYSTLLFVQGKSNLNEYGIGCGVTNITPTQPPFSHLDPSKCIVNIV